ncbi:MAG: response regulator, partial [Spirochaetota bacterium]
MIGSPDGEHHDRTILLVEDEAIIALNEKMTLERHGYEVVTATTGEEAVELATSDAGIELVLMDINLGSGIDGTEAAEMILAARELPVVFLSSHTEPEIVERTEKITSYGYIVKNSGETVLATSVKMAFRLFDSRKLADDTFRHSMNGLCVHRMLYDEAGEPFDCEYLKVNEAFELHTGLSAHRVVGGTIRDLYPGEPAREVIDFYAGIVSSGTPNRRELYFEPLGQWFELGVFPTRDDEFTVVVQNITARKHSEQIIAAEKEWLNVTLQSVGDAVIATDVDGKVA